MRKLILRTLRSILWTILKLLDVIANHEIFRGKLETISSRAGRARAKGKTWGCVLCQWLDNVDPGHCDRAVKEPLAGLGD